MIKWGKFVDWIFFAAIGYIGFNLSDNISELNKAVTTLNQQVAVILSVNTATQETLKDHEQRIRFLEQKK